MVVFRDLAPELVQLVGYWLVARDLRSLRLTCHTLSHDLLPLVFQSITLNTKQLDRDIVERLVFLSTAPESLLRLIRHVELGSLSPVRLPPLDQIHKRITLPDPPYVEHNLKHYLPTVLTSFQSAQSLKWVAHLTDQPWSQSIIVGSIGKLKNLNSLQMSLTFCAVSLPLGLLRHATKVSVTIGQHNHLPAGNVVEEFASCVGAAPHITSIEFDRLLPVSVSDSVVSLDDLLNQLTEPIRLQRLALNCCVVRMEPHMQHLRHLTSLKLTHVPQPRSSSRHLLDIASFHTEIWNTFTEHGLRLQEILLDKVVPELVTYLASYSGLTSFEVKLPHDSGIISSNEGLASQFYKALHRHSNSLQVLLIQPFDSGPWCYEPISELRQLVTSCANLKSLTVVLVPDHDASVTTKTIFGDLIDVVILHLPFLQVLAIHPGNRRLPQISADMSTSFAFRRRQQTSLYIVESFLTARYSCSRIKNCLPELHTSIGIHVPVLRTSEHGESYWTYVSLTDVHYY